MLLGLWLEDVEGPFKGILRGGGVSEREIPLASAGNLLLREASGGDTKAQGIGPTTIFDRGAALTIGIFAAAVTRCGDLQPSHRTRLSMTAGMPETVAAVHSNVGEIVGSGRQRHTVFAVPAA